MRILRMLTGIAMLASLATAPGASASEFHASSGPVSLTGEQLTAHKISVTGSSITCTTAKMTGTAWSKTQHAVNLYPQYSGCTAFGFVGATINSVGCYFEFDADFGIDFWGCSNGAMTITASSAFGKCVLEIPVFLGWNGTSYANEGSSPNRKVIVTFNATNLHMRVTTSTGICPVAAGTHTNGTYTGTSVVTPSSGEFWRE